MSPLLGCCETALNRLVFNLSEIFGDDPAKLLGRVADLKAYFAKQTLAPILVCEMPGVWMVAAFHKATKSTLNLGWNSRLEFPWCPDSFLAFADAAFLSSMSRNKVFRL